MQTLTGKQVSKNITAGEEITDLRQLVALWEEGKSVVVYSPNYTYIRSAGFMCMWPLDQLCKLRFFHSVKIEQPKTTKERKHGYAKRLPRCEHEFVSVGEETICAKCGQHPYF